MLRVLRNAIALAKRRHPELKNEDTLFALEYIRVVITEEMIKLAFPDLRPNELDHKRKPYA